MYAYAGNNPTTNTDPTGEDYRICVTGEDNSQTCTTYQNEAAFLDTLQNPGPGITVQGNESAGTIYGTDANGNSVQVGTYEEVPGPGTEGPGIQDATADLINTAYLVNGAANLVRGAVGGISSLFGSIFGGEGAGITTLGIGRIVAGQTLKTVVQTAEGPLQITAQVETQGTTIILKNFSVVSPEGLGTVTNPGVGALKAAMNGLKTTLAQNGFTQAQVQALRVSGANAPRLINMTINLSK